MRECRAIRKAIHAHLDGELPAEHDRRLAAHVDRCPQCRAALEAASRARTLLRAQPGPEVPAGLAAAIKARAWQELTAPVRPAFPWRRVLVPVAAAAGLVLAVAFAYVVTRTADSPRVAEAPPLVTDVLPSATTPLPAETDASVAEAVEVEPEAAAEAEPARTRRSPARRSADSPTEPPAEESEAADTETPAPPPSVQPPSPPPGEMHLAFADEPALPAPVTTGAVESPATPEERPSDALAPRITWGRATLSAEEPAETAPALEGEMATGVVAGMLVDKFIEEHLLETTPALLSVVTGTPSADLGPTVVQDTENGGRFELCFTNAMRRALAQTHK